MYNNVKRTFFLQAVGFVLALVVLSQAVACGELFVASSRVEGFANGTGGAETERDPPAGFTISLEGLPTFAPGGGVLELETFGDFSNANEYIDVSLEPTSQEDGTLEGRFLGRLWNNDPSDDPFEGNLADNDRGREYDEIISSEPENTIARVELSAEDLQPLLADGIFTVSFDAFGFEVDNLQDDPDEFISVTLSLATSVPEPSGSSSLLITAGWLAVWRRRRS